MQKKHISDSGEETHADINEPLPLGIYSLLTYLPCKVHLPIMQPFSMKIGDHNFQFLIQDRKRATTILDIHNNFLDEKGKFCYPGFRLTNPVNVQLDVIYKDPFIILGQEPGNSMYYTPVTVIITDFETTFTDETVETARKALSEFIRQYQLVSRDVLAFTADELFTSPVVDFGFFHPYTEEQKKLTIEDRVKINFARQYSPVNINMKGFNMKQSGFDGKEEENARNLMISLHAVKKDEFILHSLHQAEVQIYPMRNYKAAFINSFFVIEAAIQEYVYEKKISRGVSKTKLDQLKKDISLSYMINVELPILMPDYKEEYRDFFGQINGFRTLRNDLVHNKGDITEKQARDAKSVAFKLLKILDMVVLSAQFSEEQLKNMSPQFSYSIIK